MVWWGEGRKGVRVIHRRILFLSVFLGFFSFVSSVRCLFLEDWLSMISSILCLRFLHRALLSWLSPTHSVHEVIKKKDIYSVHVIDTLKHTDSSSDKHCWRPIYTHSVRHPYFIRQALSDPTTTVGTYIHSLWRISVSHPTSTSCRRP